MQPTPRYRINSPALPDLVPSSPPRIEALSSLQRTDRSASVPLDLPNFPVRKRTNDYGTGGLPSNWGDELIGAGMGQMDGLSSWRPLQLDHPLSFGEKEQLLDRVRDDLLGVDVGSLKGPLRELALSKSAIPPLSPTLRDIRDTNAADQDSRRTVSPQEAFLDYDEVQHARFALGGSSLFAPLPTPFRSSPSRILTPPPTSSASPHTSPPSRSAHRPMRAHPFSVPQNAIRWADESATEDEKTGGMVNFNESSDTEEIETPPELDKNVQAAIDYFRDRSAPPLVATPQLANPASYYPNKDVEIESNERGAYEDHYEPPVFVTTATSFAQRRSRDGPSESRSATPYDLPERSTFDIAADALVVLPPLAPVLPYDASPYHSYSAAIASPIVPRLPSIVQQIQQNSQAGSYASEDEYRSRTPQSVEPRRSSSLETRRQAPAPTPRKRARKPVSSGEDDFDDQAAAAEEDENADDSDFSSSAASPPPRAHSRAPTKRRKSNIASAPGTIKCVHVAVDGRTCGVVFRRPYDLARHKETIHGEAGKKKPEHLCRGCGGTFSRKDALIRHMRVCKK